MKDCDMMVDAALFLWSKCKPHFQRIFSSSLENCKQLLNDVFANRVSWLYRFILLFPKWRCLKSHKILLLNMLLLILSCLFHEVSHGPFGPVSLTVSVLRKSCFVLLKLIWNLLTPEYGGLCFFHKYILFLPRVSLSQAQVTEKLVSAFHEINHHTQGCQ